MDKISVIFLPSDYGILSLNLVTQKCHACQTEAVKFWIYILHLIQHSKASDSDRKLEVCEYYHDNVG